MASAQSYYSDAILYSRSFIPGTARSAGVAGAFGAVGADLSSTGINPAGLALYRSGDFAITPALSIVNNNSDYMGSPAKSASTRFYFGQAGIVWSIPVSSKASGINFTSNPLRFVTVAINYSRQSMFNRKVAYGNVNSSTTTIDSYADYLNNTQINIDNAPDEVRLAWEAYLLNFDNVNNRYYSSVNAPVRQLGEIETRGAKDNIDFSLGFNLNDKVYLGAGLGLSIMNYYRTSWYGEDALDLTDSTTTFQSYTYSNELRIRGLGANFNIGFLYRPAPWVRFGLAYHMPTFYSLNDNYTASQYAIFDTGYKDPGISYDLFTYKYRTPMKGVFSAAFFIKQHAFISVDYEFLNYGANRFNFGRTYQSTTDLENKFIKDNLAFGHNLRVGVEGAIKVLRLRAGYAWGSTPFKAGYNAQQYNEMRHYATGGIGYRGKIFYVDMAYVYSISKDISNTPATDYVRNTLNQHQVLLTLGFRFGAKKNSAQYNTNDNYNNNSNDNYNQNNGGNQDTSPPPVDRSY